MFTPRSKGIKQENRKTLSNKATRKFAESEGIWSSAGISTHASRLASDVEDGNQSDDDSSAWSANSVDDTLAQELPSTWAQDLSERIEEILDRKRSSTQGRETTLTAYNIYLMNRFCHDEIESKTSELYPALFKSTKGGSEKEACLALRAIALTIITCPTDEAFEVISGSLKQVYMQSEYKAVKAEAIRTLAAVATCGDAGEEEISDIMDELLEIVESDGDYVDAHDNAEVVTVACEAWGLLATWVEDLEDKTEAAMDAFVEQLNSSSTSVQIAAGQNIALLFEKSYTPRENGDDSAGEEDSEAIDDDGFALDNTMVKRYDPYGRQQYQLEQTLTLLSKESSKRIPKKERTTMHASFREILNTVRYPTRGPGYSNIIKDDAKLGHTKEVRIHETGVIRISKWWKLLRLNALRTLLRGGFVTHFEHNGLMGEVLPVAMEKKRKTKK